MFFGKKGHYFVGGANRPRLGMVKTFSFLSRFAMNINITSNNCYRSFFFISLLCSAGRLRRKSDIVE